MALKSTIYKATVNLSNMDEHIYEEISVTIALHPSETEERMMVRLLAYVMNDQEGLSFGRGLSNEEEPALCVKSLTGEMVLWIDVGLPDKERIRKASHKAEQVCLYVYGGNNATTWWEQNQKAIKGYRNVSVIKIPESTSLAMATLARRTMNLSCSIQDGSIWLSDDEQTLEVSLEQLK